MEITRPDKLLWPALDITKQAFVDYLDAVAEHMLPWLRERPLTVIRAPDGVDGQRYFQKQTPAYAPSWIRTVTIPAPSAKRDVAYTVCNDAATLAWLGNQAALEFHPAPVRRDRLGATRPVRRRHRSARRRVRRRCGGRVPGSRGPRRLQPDRAGEDDRRQGLHVVVPIVRHTSPEQLRRAATGLTTIVAGRRPDLVTAEFRKASRKGRVMLDPSRNGPGATIVAPYSPRARRGDRVVPRSPRGVAVDHARSLHHHDGSPTIERRRVDALDKAASERHQRLPASLLRD